MTEYPVEKFPALVDEFRQSINRACRENVSNTPDFVLAE